METIKTLSMISSKVFENGKIIYSEDGNSYETVEVYILFENGLLIGHYISEHGFDGSSSWKVINLDKANLTKLRQVIKEEYLDMSVESFLKKEFYETEAATAKFVDFLNENRIVYECKCYY